MTVASPFAGERVVLYEGAGAQVLAPGRRHAIVAGLLDAGYDIRLSGPDAQRGPAEGNEDCAAVLGRFDSAPAADLPVLDIGEQAPDEVVSELKTLLDKTENPSAKGRWLPWFPVIDRDRCTDCMQCLNFCLFGVYDRSEDQKLVVNHPENCKTNCPACSRVCPEVAIMFPKYKNGPINGEAVKEEDVDREHMKVDVSSLLGGDIYQLLRERSVRFKSRFAAERDDDKALRERIKCLKKLAADVPAEVLASLQDVAGDTGAAREIMDTVTGEDDEGGDA